MNMMSFKLYFSLFWKFSIQFNLYFPFVQMHDYNLRQRKTKIKMVCKFWNQRKSWATTDTCVTLLICDLWKLFFLQGRDFPFSSCGRFFNTLPAKHTEESKEHLCDALVSNFDLLLHLVSNVVSFKAFRLQDVPIWTGQNWRFMVLGLSH